MSGIIFSATPKKPKAAVYECIFKQSVDLCHITSKIQFGNYTCRCGRQGIHTRKENIVSLLTAVLSLKVWKSAQQHQYGNL